MSQSYYSDEYYGKNNGCLAVIVGGLCIWGFIAWSDHSAINRPVTQAEEELRIEQQSAYRDEARIRACKEGLAKQKAYVASGQSARDIAARDREINKNSFDMWDVLWCSLFGAGSLVWGWRLLRGVATPFEALGAVACWIVSIVIVCAIGPGAFVMLVCCGGLVLLMCSVLGNDCINRGRHVRDGYDEEFGVNERRAQRRMRR